jgi:hypothetical protein
MLSKLKYFEKFEGVDIGFHDNMEHPDFPNSKRGYSKNFTLETMISLAKDINANVILKAGKNAKWYLKKCNRNKINERIETQKWRDTSGVIMYVVDFE